jgi:hypothetical protein
MGPGHAARTLMGGGKRLADQAGLFNSGLTRYVAHLDGYMSPDGLAHPRENLTPAGRSGVWRGAALFHNQPCHVSGTSPGIL